MTYQEACNILNAAGIETAVTMRSDDPVELLFWDKGMNRFNHFCNIEGECVEENAAADILDMYA
jgi:hypothetical protein